MTMKPILLSLALLALLCAPASGQTLKALSYNTTNGEVAYTGTNVLRLPDFVVDGGISISYDKMRWEGGERLNFETLEFFDTWTFNSPLDFATTEAAATTRTNLGLYNTNAPAAFAALALWDEANDVVGLRVVDDEIRLAPILIGTSAPTDTTNAVKWIRVVEGTNSYRLPLFQ